MAEQPPVDTTRLSVRTPSQIIKTVGGSRPVAPRPNNASLKSRLARVGPLNKEFLKKAPALRMTETVSVDAEASTDCHAFPPELGGTGHFPCAWTWHAQMVKAVNANPNCGPSQLVAYL